MASPRPASQPATRYRRDEGEFFKELIEEVRIYNRALSAAEITADMTTPVVP